MLRITNKITHISRAGARNVKTIIATLAALVALALLLPTMSTVGTSSASAGSGEAKDKPTVVLVHGAFADDSSRLERLAIGLRRGGEQLPNNLF